MRVPKKALKAAIVSANEDYYPSLLKGEKYPN